LLSPLLVDWITYLSGSQRLGKGTTIVFFVIGFLLMLTVPPDRKIEAGSDSRAGEAGD